jgi:hypothetical protein
VAWRVLRVVCVCIATFAAAAASAWASPEPLAPVSPSPASGATLTPQGAIAFKLTSPSSKFGNLQVIVAAQPLLLASGELGEAIEHINLSPVPGEKGVYAGSSLFAANQAGWSFTPGTYYWQVTAVYTETTSTPPFIRASEEWSEPYTLVIAPATSIPTGGAAQTPGSSAPAPGVGSQAPSVLSLTAAYARVKREITHRTGHRPIRLHASCTRPAGAGVRCRTNWLSGAPASRSTLRYSGTFQLVSSASAVRVSFSGVRERLACTRRHGSRRCQSHVRW